MRPGRHSASSVRRLPASTALARALALVVLLVVSTAPIAGVAAGAPASGAAAAGAPASGAAAAGAPASGAAAAGAPASGAAAAGTPAGGAAAAGTPAGGAVAVTEETATRDPHPTIERAYPNPVAPGDSGEFVLIDVPPGVDPGKYVLSDGSWHLSLAGLPAGKTVAVADHPRVQNPTDHPVVVREYLVLANAGERLRIQRARTDDDTRRTGAPLQVAEYRNAPEGEIATWNGPRPRWRPLGATDRPVVSTGPASVEAFVLPDSPDRAVEFLRGADERILLAGYTLTSERVTDALRTARARNVTVRVLLEAEPVGGRTRRGARVLDRLDRAGVEVRVLGGPLERYHYHHAKYAVVDDRAIVLTENWKPAGVGGNSSRGWAAITHEPAIVAGLAGTFRADASAPDAIAWHRYRVGRSFQLAERSSGSYPSRFEPAALAVDGVELLVAPDNAQARLVRTIERANDSVDVVQASLGDWNEPLLVALRRAARRGVEVRILLSDAWYVREDNRRLVERFGAWATERDLPLNARTATPGGRFEKIHAKGAIVDDRVVLGSLNWNEQAATGNREVMLVLHGDSAATYFGRVFDADWRGGRSTVPLGVVTAVLGTFVLVGLVARKVDFEGSSASRWRPSRLPVLEHRSPVTRRSILEHVPGLDRVAGRDRLPDLDRWR